MTNTTLYNVRFTAGDKTSSAEIDMQIYNLLFFKNYDSAPEFEEINGKVVVKIEKNNKSYRWPTTNQISDILKEEYSLSIIE
jgi:hypothetical protein